MSNRFLDSSPRLLLLLGALAGFGAGAAAQDGPHDGAQDEAKPASAPAPSQGEAASRPAGRRAGTGTGRATRPAPGVPIAIENVTILGRGEPEKGTILVRGRKIAAVGANVTIPGDARKIDGAGATVTAGWIDARGEAPLDPESASDGAPNASFRADEGLDLLDTQGRVRDALAQGIVASYVSPGRGLIGGTGLLVRLRPNDKNIDRLLVDGTDAMAFNGGSTRGFPPVGRLNDWNNLRRILREAQKYREALDQYAEDKAKFLEEKKKGAKTASRPADPRAETTPAPGDRPPTPNPRNRRPPRNETEREFLAMARILGIPPIVESRDGGFLLDDTIAEPAAIEEGELDCCADPKHQHRNSASRHSANEPPMYVFQQPAQSKPGEKAVERPKKPDWNADQEALLPALRREVVVRFEARRADEIRAAIAIAHEFKFRAVIEGCDEAGLVLDEIADSKIPVVLSPVRGSNETEGYERSASLAADLAKRKIPFAIGTGRGAYAGAWLRAQVAMAIAGGLSRNDALAAVTSQAADILGIESDMGALRPGQEANLVLFNGDPFDPTTPVKMVISEGEVLFQR
jgi:imidazolonepropionase-like amidohydrolase